MAGRSWGWVPYRRDAELLRFLAKLWYLSTKSDGVLVSSTWVFDLVEAFDEAFDDL